jgi:hypothetical protein
VRVAGLGHVREVRLLALVPDLQGGYERVVRDEVLRPRSGKAKTTSDETGQRFLVGR